ncbi:MAG: iron hydrogenase small subunit, partial [Syntrophothermus sp.]
GFKTGAGLIFGNSGGVTEAALRYLYEKVSGEKLQNFEFHEVRGTSGLREADITINGSVVKVAVVHGLRNAGKIAEEVKNGTSGYDFIEVMSCPNGCIGGAGQPVSFDDDIKARRTKGLYEADRKLQLHKSQENPFVSELYSSLLGEPGSHRAHELLHTHYSSRRRISDAEISLHNGTGNDKLEVKVCVGTSCYLKGSQDLLYRIIDRIEGGSLQDRVDVKATFCFEQCDKGPSVNIGGRAFEGCTLDTAMAEIEDALNIVK